MSAQKSYSRTYPDIVCVEVYLDGAEDICV